MFSWRPALLNFIQLPVDITVLLWAGYSDELLFMYLLSRLPFWEFYSTLLVSVSKLIWLKGNQCKLLGVFFSITRLILHMSQCMTKPTKWHVRPAKTRISLGIHPVWWESLLCAQWVAKDPNFLHADSEDSDQTGRIWAFVGRTCHFVGDIYIYIIYIYIYIKMYKRGDNNKRFENCHSCIWYSTLSYSIIL